MKMISAITAALMVASTAATAIQFSVKNHVFNDLRDSFLPKLFSNISDGYSLGPQWMGSKWAGVNLTSSLISLPCNDSVDDSTRTREKKFTKDFLVIPPAEGSSVFGIKMSNMRIDLNGNITGYFLQMESSGTVDALLSNLGIEFELDVNTTQKGNQSDLAPKIVVKNLKINLDKKQSNITISGGISKWMISFIEREFSKTLLSFVVTEFEKEMQTTFQDQINQNATNYLQKWDYSNNLNLDFSMSDSPVNNNGTYHLDVNGLFTNALSQNNLPIERLSQEVINEVMDMDMVGVLRLETIQSLFDTIWEKNLTFDLKNFKVWQNGADNSTCEDVQSWMPNMDYDLKCNDRPGGHYQIDYTYKIVNKPPKVILTDGYLSMTGLDVQFHSWKIEDGVNKTLMNFIMGNMTVTVNQTMQEDLSLSSDSTIEFNQPKLVERGILVKSERDIYRISDHIEGLKNDYNNDNFDGQRIKYIANSVMHKWDYKIDAKNQAIFVGMDADPAFYGLYQRNFDRHQN